jgi:hypothetical protein
MQPRVLFYESAHPGTPVYLHWDGHSDNIVVQSNFTYWAALNSSQMTTRDIFTLLNIPIHLANFSIAADKCMDNFIDTPIKELTHQYTLYIRSEQEQPVAPIILGHSLVSPLPPAISQSMPARTMAYVHR